MRTQIAAIALAVFALFSAAPRSARACGSGYDGALVVVGIGALALGGADTAILISDGVIAAQNETPSVGHGVAELLLGLPTTLIGGALLAAGANDSGSDGAGFFLFAGAVTAVGLFMDIHAIWTFSAQPPTTPPMRAGRKLYGTAQLQAAALASPAPGASTAPPPPLPAYQLSVAPTVLAVRDRAAVEKLAPGLGAVLRF